MVDLLLAWVLRNQIPFMERPWRLNDYIGPVKRAFELADSVSEPERLWIQASYYRFKGQLEKSANLYHVLRSMGKTQQAKELEEAMRRRWAVADPDHPVRAVLDGAEKAR